MQTLYESLKMAREISKERGGYSRIYRCQTLDRDDSQDNTMVVGPGDWVPFNCDVVAVVSRNGEVEWTKEAE